MQELSVKVSALYCYPVKGLGAIDLAEAELTSEGLAWDRRWMLVDDKQRFITQRQLPAMAAIKVRLEHHQLVLVAPDGRYLSVPLVPPRGEPIATRVHGQPCFGVDEGDEAAAFFTRQFQQHWKGDIRLLRFAHDTRPEPCFTRQVPLEHSRQVEHQQRGVSYTAFADGYPLLVASSSSLDRLNQGMAQRGLPPAEMVRFRPNVVVDGLAPFAEHDVETLMLSHGAIRLWLCKPCERCPVTRVDQTLGTITHPHEPLPLLKNLGPFPGIAIFGVNAVVLAGHGQWLKVGASGTCHGK